MKKMQVIQFVVFLFLLLAITANCLYFSFMLYHLSPLSTPIFFAIQKYETFLTTPTNLTTIFKQNYKSLVNAIF